MNLFYRQLEHFRLPMIAMIMGCVAVCSLDVPTPVSVEKDTTVAFPCQTRGCSCQNATDCWTSCCCFTDTQKLAWAKANGVTPPDWFLAKMTSADSLAATEPKKCCCCCQKIETKESTARVPVTENDTRAKQASVDSSAAASITVRLNLKQQRGCQGQTDLFQKHLVYLVEPTLPRVAEPMSFLPVPRTASFTPIVLDPPTPPPRWRLSA